MTPLLSFRHHLPPWGKSIIMSCWFNIYLLNVLLSPSYCNHFRPSQLISFFDYCISFLIDLPASICCEIIFWCIYGVFTPPYFHDVMSGRKLHERKELRLRTLGGQYYCTVFHCSHILLKHFYCCGKHYYF